jgi:hypothetical protein
LVRVLAPGFQDQEVGLPGHPDTPDAAMAGGTARNGPRKRERKKPSRYQVELKDVVPAAAAAGAPKRRRTGKPQAGGAPGAGAAVCNSVHQQAAHVSEAAHVPEALLPAAAVTQRTSGTSISTSAKLAGKKRAREELAAAEAAVRLDPFTLELASDTAGARMNAPEIKAHVLDLLEHGELEELPQGLPIANFLKIVRELIADMRKKEKAEDAAERVEEKARKKEEEATRKVCVYTCYVTYYIRWPP